MICINSISRLRKVLLFFIIIMSYISLYALFHASHGPGNYFLDENDLSLYVNMWLPFCYFLLFSEKKFTNKIIYFFGLVIGVTVVFVSSSRGGFVGLVSMLPVVWYFSTKKFVTLILFVSIITILLLCLDPGYWTEMSTITDVDNHTASERIDSWNTAWDMFIDKPFGVGGNNFQVWFADYQEDRFTRVMWGRVVHSLWFTLISELGVFGILIYGLLMFFNIRDSFLLKNKKFYCENMDSIYLNKLGCAFVCSLVGFFASATFLSVLYYPHYWYMSGLIAVAIRVANMFDRQCLVRAE